MTNNYRPHLYILPEDDANRQIANGFLLETPNSNQARILKEAGGWLSVVEVFNADHAGAMEMFRDRIMVLIVDLNGALNRRQKVLDDIPTSLRDRVFILGARPDPEALKRELSCSFEKIGRAMAKQCLRGDGSVWERPALQENAPELHRLRQHIRTILA